MSVAAYPKYESYRQSGEGWLEEVPEHWKSRKLKQLFKEKKHKANMTLNCGALSFGVVVEKDDERIPVATKASYQEVSPGEFLINPLNLNYDLKSLRIGLSNINVVVSAGYIVLQTITEMNKRYFNYLLHRYDVACMKLLGSGVRQTISFNHIASSQLVVPPLLEQHAITAFLDEKCAKIDEAVRIKEEQIKLLRERRQILIQQAVTLGLNPNAPMKDSGIDWIGSIPTHWEVKKLKYASKIFRGKFTHRPRNDPRLYDGQYPFFQTGDVARAGMFLSNYKQTLNEAGLRVSTLIPKGTILITIAANIGDVAILDIDGCFPDSVVGFRPSKAVRRDFLFYSMSAMKSIFINNSIANAQANLNVDRIGGISITLPPIDEQLSIMQHVAASNAKIDKAISIKEEQITALREYKATLINAAVTGKIKVT